LGESPAGVVAVGFAISRNIKQVTKRNRVKRVLREAWRKISSGVEAHCHSNRTTLELVILYTGGDDRRKQTVAAIMSGVAELAKRLMDQIQRKQ
jgi:ribonuclease P protein component